MLTWSLKELELPLKFSPQGKNETFFFIELKDSSYVATGEVACSKRFGETPELIHAKFKEFKDQYSHNISSISELKTFIDTLELPNSLKAGIEIAFLNYLSMVSERSVSDLLGVDQVTMVKTSFTMPSIPVGEMAEFIRENNLERFEALKIKVRSESALETVREIVKTFKGKIRIDGNETWTNPDEVIQFVENIRAVTSLDFLEQPLPFDHHDGYLYLKEKIDVPLVADESLVAGEVNAYFRERFHGVKIKLMKAGGTLNALQQAGMAKGLGLRPILGCRMETSLGIAAAMSIASPFDFLDLDGCLFIENDPYNMVFEESGRIFLSYLQ